MISHHEPDRLVTGSQSQPGRNCIRHGEGNPIAADLVLCRDRDFDFDIALAEITCQIVTNLLEGVVASGLVYCPLDVEGSEASGRSEFLLGDRVGLSSIGLELGEVHVGMDEPAPEIVVVGWSSAPPRRAW